VTEPRLTDDNDLAVAVSGTGDIAVQLPDGRPMVLIGPKAAREMAAALVIAANTADRVRAALRAKRN
jgi:hypothetical protein